MRPKKKKKLSMIIRAFTTFFKLSSRFLLPHRHRHRHGHHYFRPNVIMSKTISSIMMMMMPSLSPKSTHDPLLANQNILI